MTSHRPLRKDAAENQEKVLAAAVTTMLRGGRNVPLAAIAAEAHVGVGTLYRRYANRDALLADLELRAYQIVIDTLEGILAREESGLNCVGLFVDATIEHRTQLVLPLHGSPVGTSERAQTLRKRMYALVVALVARGRDDGTIRADVRPFDIVIFASLLAQPLSNVPRWEDRVEPQKEIFLRGIAGPHARVGSPAASPGPPGSPESPGPPEPPGPPD